jgi:hypothetical protein
MKKKVIEHESLLDQHCCVLGYELMYFGKRSDVSSALNLEEVCRSEMLVTMYQTI